MKVIQLGGFMNVSIQNPYNVIAGYIMTSHLHDSPKHQMSLAIRALFHPNPLVVFVLIKVIPEFRCSSFIDYQQLKYNEVEPVDENCESSYWFLARHSTYGSNFFHEYLLMNQIPCPYVYCHYSNSTICPINKKILKNCISATVVCNNHLMSFAEFGYEDGRSVLYHKITNEHGILDGGDNTMSCSGQEKGCKRRVGSITPVSTHTSELLRKSVFITHQVPDACCNMADVMIWSKHIKNARGIKIHDGCVDH
ncbi:hypothetical protein ACI65C_001985 [Semiaphis heraclei]